MLAQKSFSPSQLSREQSVVLRGLSAFRTSAGHTMRGVRRVCCRTMKLRNDFKVAIKALSCLY